MGTGCVLPVVYRVMGLCSAWTPSAVVQDLGSPICPRSLPSSLVVWVSRLMPSRMLSIYLQLTSLSLVTQLTKLDWTVFDRLDCMVGFGDFTSHIMFRSDIGSNLRLARGLLDSGWGIPQGCSLSVVFNVALCVLCCRKLESLQLHADNEAFCLKSEEGLLHVAQRTTVYAQVLEHEVYLG